MSDFDPFGGSQKPKKKVKVNDSLSKQIKPIITVVIILIVAYLIIYQVFLNYAEIDLNIENTEAEKIREGSISFRKTGNQETQRFSFSDKIKIRKGMYSYVIMVPEYKLYTSENTNFKDKITTISAILEKNINLSIENFKFLDGEEFFAGQKAEAEITLKNTSTSETYYLNIVDYVGDIKDWNYYYIDYFGEPIDKETMAVPVSTTKKYNVVFEIPEDIKTGDLKIQPKINYLKKENHLETEIKIIEVPEIKISCINTKATYVFGEEAKNIVCEIDNSKNQLVINDLEVLVNVVSDDQRNEDVNTWFTTTQGNVLVSKASKKDEIIQVNIPSDNAYPATISGEVVFKSKYLTDSQKSYEIEIVVEEPDISFEVSLTQNNLTLEYDVANGSSDMKNTTLKLNNKNNFRIEVVDVNVLSPGLIKDCENLIYYDKEFVLGNILSKQTNEVPLTITVLEPSMLDQTSNLTRQCSLKIVLKNPFREGDVLEYNQLLEITTNILEELEE